MDNHQLALAEVFAVLDRVRNGFTTPCADIAERAQALAHCGQCGCHFLRVQPRYAENTRLNAGDRFRGQKCLQAGVFAVFVSGANDVGNCLLARLFRRFCGAFGHANNNDNRFTLVSNRLQRSG